MVNKNTLTNRIELVDHHLKRVLPYRRLSKDDFFRDINAQDIVEYNFFQIVNHLMNIIEHIAVDEDYGLPQSAYDAAHLLSQKGIFNKRDLDILRKMIGFRNVVGHDYISLNKDIIYKILTDGHKDIRCVLNKITKRFL